MSQTSSIFNRIIYSKKKLTNSSSKMTKQIKKDNEKKLQLKSIFSFFYDQKFQDILLLSDKDFISYLEDKFDKIIKNNFSSSNNIQNEINKTKIEKVKKRQFEIFRQEKQLLKTELSNFERDPDNYKFLTNFQKHCPNTGTIAIHPCFSNSFGKFIQIKNENKSNEYYLICIKCKKCYKSDFIYLYCKSCKKNYYSCIVNFSNKNINEKNLPYATWKNYHCGSIINSIMKCIKCKNNLLYDEKLDILICSNRKCNFIGNPKKIIWKCAVCGSDFNSEVKRYNPLEIKMYTNAIKYALLLKELAKPPNIVYCNYCSKSLKNVIYYHKIDCKGELYMGKLQNEDVIICSKCHRINDFSKFIWTCPFCEKRLKRPLFSFNKRGNLSNIDQFSCRNSNISNSIYPNKTINKIFTKEYENTYINDQSENSNEKKNLYEKRNTANSSKPTFYKFMSGVYSNYMTVRHDEDSKSKENEKKSLKLKNDINNTKISNNLCEKHNMKKNKTSSKNTRNVKQTLYDILSSRKNINNTNSSSFSNSTKNNNINTMSTKYPNSINNISMFNSDSDNNHEFSKNKDILGRNFNKQNINNNEFSKKKHKEFNLTCENFTKIKKSKTALFNNMVNSIKKNNEQISAKNKNDTYIHRIKIKHNSNNISEFNNDLLYSTRENINTKEVKKTNSILENMQRISVRRRFIRNKKNNKKTFDLPANDANDISSIINDEEKEKEIEKSNKKKITNNNSVKYFIKNNNDQQSHQTKSICSIFNKIYESPIKFRDYFRLKKDFNNKENKTKNENMTITNPNNEKNDNVIIKKKKNLIVNNYLYKKTNSNNIHEKSNISYENNINSKTSTTNNKFSTESDLTSTQIISGNKLKPEINKPKTNGIIKPNYFLNTKYILSSHKKNIMKNSLKYFDKKLSTSMIEKKKTTKLHITPSKNSLDINVSNESKIKSNKKHAKTDIKNDKNVEEYNQIFNDKEEKEKKNNKNNVDEEDSLEKEIKNLNFDEINENNTNIIINNNKSKKVCFVFSETINIEKTEPVIVPDIIACTPEMIKKLSEVCIIPQFSDFDYVYLDSIGEGAFGTVFSVKEKSSDQVYALKKIICKNYQELLEIKNKVELCYLLKHDNIMKVYKIQYKYLDFTTYSVGVLMEKALYDWSREIIERRKIKKYYTQNELINILKQLIDALQFLEKKTIAHRDIKPQNILIYPNNIYKIADLGEAKNLGDTKTKLVTLKGCELYMSPVLYSGLRNSKKDVCHNAYKSDIFSLGYCFLNAMCLENYVLEQIRDLNKKEDIIVVINKFIGNKLYSKTFVDLIYNMIEVDENKRYDYSRIYKELENF